jgi:hypothetical protein
MLALQPVKGQLEPPSTILVVPEEQVALSQSAKKVSPPEEK